MTITELCLYCYLALVTSVYDGDTITVDIDLGLGVWKHSEKIRVAHINAPEVRGKERPEGLKSRDWLRERINGKQIIIKTLKDKKGKYGRYIGEIYLDGVNINDEIVKAGFAEYRDY